MHTRRLAAPIKDRPDLRMLMKISAPKTGPETTDTCDRRSRRILCAEDHEQVAGVLRMALERAGHRVDCVADGEQAFERIAASADGFDVLITDHQMPRVSGLALVGRLRAAAFTGKIIVHSASLSVVEAKAYQALGVEHILSKPARLETLLTLVADNGRNRHQ